MRIRISFDSATTKQVRDLSVALNRATLASGNRLTLGVEGPECWGGETPNLTPDQFAQVVAHLVKVDGDLFADALAAVAAQPGMVGGMERPTIPPVDPSTGIVI